ncbi:MAG: chemotaxis protein CheA [Candidatus Omnitrophica bacterium]|nr:chemotaxis protein CheA [Candidatus Omnitrophota bacterium]
MGVDQYRALFVAESEEHLQIINNAVLVLEKDPQNIKILNEIFRSAHTLKGMSATMGFEALTKLTHKMEDVLDIFRTQKIGVTTEVVDKLFDCLDMLQLLLEEIKEEKDLRLDVDSVIAKLASVIPSIFAIGKSKIEETKEISLTSLEKQNLAIACLDQKSKIYLIDIYLSADCQLKSVSVFMIFHKLGQIGEVIKASTPIEDFEVTRMGHIFSLLFLSSIAKKKIEQALNVIMEIEKVVVKHISDLNDICEEKDSTLEANVIAAVNKNKAEGGAQQANFKKIQSIRVSTQRLDKLMNFVGELVISKIRLMQIAKTHQLKFLTEVLTSIDRLTSDLQDEVMQARLIPMSQVFDRFPRMVRDLARSEKKQINLEVTGGEIELDRTVLDEIADPLVHLLRNSINHGIELPQDRKEKKKSLVGTIKLSALRERTYVLVRVSDDGKGIDPNELRKLAVEKGFMEEEEAAKTNDKDILSVILMPGFSSAKEITDISGRGVGMDVVKIKIESLGGSLLVDSEVNKGSSFNLKLPLTVAIINAMLVEVNEEIYAAPIANIAETVKIKQSRIKHIEKFEVINLRNEVLPLLRLNIALKNSQVNSLQSKNEDIIKNKEDGDKEIAVVVVESGTKKAGLVVDRVLGQQEVVVKSVGSFLKGIKGFSGATILGDGKVVLILDVATLIG